LDQNCPDRSRSLFGTSSLLPNYIGKREEGRRKKEEGRRKKEEGRRKKEEGRRKKELLVFEKRK